ncbi:MAG: molybdenum cofactor guanylyltransferase [Chlorobi bacterium]|nr:molybdenum cofactor guanylyltransferase [Chlorobiota bacterium]
MKHINLANKTKYTGIILAGGRSSRMGKDKALLKINGKTFIEILCETLTPFCTEIIISSDKERTKAKNCRSVPDKIKNTGPAGGLYSSLSKSGNEKNIVVSVDTPFVSADLINFMTASDKKHLYALIVSENSRMHPTTGIYSKKAVRIFENEIINKNYKLMNIIEKMPNAKIEISGQVFYNSKILKNINTKEDYKELSELK